jgi:hypothetical protein
MGIFIGQLGDEEVNTLVAQKIFKKEVFVTPMAGRTIEVKGFAYQPLPNYCNGEHLDNLMMKLSSDNVSLELEVYRGSFYLSMEDEDTKKDASTGLDMNDLVKVTGKPGISRTICELALEIYGVDPEDVQAPNIEQSK